MACSIEVSEACEIFFSSTAMHLYRARLEEKQGSDALNIVLR